MSFEREGLLRGFFDGRAFRTATFPSVWGSHAGRLETAFSPGRVDREVMDGCIDFLAQIFPDLVRHAQENIHNFRIELTSGPEFDFRFGRRKRASGAIR